MSYIESSANQIVEDFVTVNLRECYDKLDEAKKTNPEEGVLWDLVTDMNLWISFLELADAYPRFRVVESKGKKEKVEIYYP